MQTRLQWCHAHSRWTARQWNQVLFSDKSRFILEKADGRVRVYRRVGERYSDACVTEVDCFRRGSVMVWNGINHQGKTDLVVIQGNLNVHGYINDVLRPVVCPLHKQSERTSNLSAGQCSPTHGTCYNTILAREQH